MRLVAVLAAAACIAVLSLVASPGSAGSRPPSRPSGVDPALLQPLLASRAAAPSVGTDSVDWSRAGTMIPELPVGGGGDPLLTTDSFAMYSTVAGRIEAWDGGPVLLAEGLRPPPTAGRPARPSANVPSAVVHEAIVLHGIASWYDNGTTAMRWPRGARVRICGPAACVNRVVTDWGPDFRLHPDRVVDLMPVDFVRVCGCSLRIGLTQVSVQIIG